MESFYYLVHWPEKQAAFPKWSRDLSHQNRIVHSFSPLCHHQRLNFTIYSKTRVLSTQNNEKERGYPWDVGYLTKAFGKVLKAWGIIGFCVCFKVYTAQKQTNFVCVIFHTVEQTNKSAWESLAHCPRADWFTGYSHQRHLPTTSWTMS